MKKSSDDDSDGISNEDDAEVEKPLKSVRIVVVVVVVTAVRLICSCGSTGAIAIAVVAFVIPFITSIP